MLKHLKSVKSLLHDIQNRQIVALHGVQIIHKITLHGVQIIHKITNLSLC